jgi:hypothetical protein
MMSTIHDSKVILKAKEIYSFEGVEAEKDLTLSVVASPFYMPKKASASFTIKGDLEIHFFYSHAVKTEIKNAAIDGLDARYEVKTGRVKCLIIPGAQVPKHDSFHLKLEIEGVSDRAVSLSNSRNTEIHQEKINMGSLNAALRSLKAYSSEYSKAALMHSI